MAGGNDQFDEALRNSTSSIERERLARERLNGAMDALGTVVGSVIRGAPQNMADILRGAGFDTLSKMMQFAEGYIGVWRQLTQSGLHFNNQFDTMITAVGAANLRLEQFQKVLSQNTLGIIANGYSMQSGATEFLRLQAEFMRIDAGADQATRDARIRLEQLGMTAETIAHRFAEFDALAAINNTRSRMTDRERNLAAAQYAENLNELSRLTGKQVEKLAQEQAQIAKRGNVFAFGQMIDEGVRDELTQGLSGMAQLGPSMERYAIDMITRGVPDPNDPAQRAIHSAMPELAQALQNARAALQDGNEQLAEEYFRQARLIGASATNNQALINRSVWGSATEMTRASMNLLTEVNNSALRFTSDVIRRKAEEMFPESRNNLSADQLARAEQRLMEDERNAQLAGTTQSQQILNGYLESMRGLSAAAQEAQRLGVQNIMTEIGSAMTTLTTRIAQMDLQGPFQTALRNALGFTTALGGAVSDQNVAIRAGQQLQDTLAQLGAARQGDEATRAEGERISRIAQELGAAVEAFRTNPNIETSTRLEELIRNAQEIQTANRDVVVTGNNVNIITNNINSFLDSITNAIRQGLGLPRNPQSVGTLGTQGRLFGDWGSGTLATLHGLEAVVTPSQMADIVQSSALGALRASTSIMQESQARNNSTMLSGMLNTIRTLPAEMSALPSNSQIDYALMQQTFASAMMNLKGPMEDAMNSTLLPKLQELVTATVAHADTSDKIRRGIGDMSGDLMRSV